MVGWMVGWMDGPTDGGQIGGETENERGSHCLQGLYRRYGTRNTTRVTLILDEP